MIQYPHLCFMERITDYGIHTKDRTCNDTNFLLNRALYWYLQREAARFRYMLVLKIDQYNTTAC
jgi:hypothetical protein